jgi:hypothetical protein
MAPTMSLAGQAFLALWNDIAPGREPDYDQWHTLEHVPERVAVAGYNGARRYVNRARQHHRYFTLYDVDSLAVFDSAEYRDLLDHPTPWSASMRPDFSNFLRAICVVTSSQGMGIGAAIACLCLPASITGPDLSAAVDDARSFPRVTAVHVGSTTQGAPPVPFGSPPPSSAAVRPFDRIALIEALDRDAAAHALSEVKHALRLDALPADFGADVYDLAFVFPGNDARERFRHRRAGWDAANDR